MLDVWNDEENGENSSKIKIKEEKLDPEEKPRKTRDDRDSKKRTSTSNGDISSRSDRSRQSGSSKRSDSYERVRKRNISPDRRRSPSPHRRSNDNAKARYLKELKEILEKEGKDPSFLKNVNVNDTQTTRRNDNRPRNFSRYQQQQFMHQQQQQQQQNAMFESYNYGWPNMQNMQFQQFNAAPIVPQVSYDMYGNSMMQPIMMMQTPQPVPAPQITAVPQITPVFNPPVNENSNPSFGECLTVVKAKSSGNVLKKVRKRLKFD